MTTSIFLLPSAAGIGLRAFYGLSGQCRLCSSAYWQPKYRRPPWQPCGGERSAPVNRGARLARGFTAFSFWP